MLLLLGCATGKGISHIPDRGAQKCDDVTWYNPQSSALSGWSVPYYIIPLWYEQWDHSDENLRVKLYFKVEMNNRDSFTTHDVYLKAAETENEIQPSSVIITSDGSYENSRFLMYQLEFPLASGSLNEFDLVFIREIHGCKIESINYKKSEYDFNSKVL
jgi:hypothetical protein